MKTQSINREKKEQIRAQLGHDRLTTLPRETTLRKVEFLLNVDSSASSSASRAAACNIESDNWISSSIASMAVSKARIEPTASEYHNREYSNEIASDLCRRRSRIPLKPDRENEIWRKRNPVHDLNNPTVEKTKARSRLVERSRDLKEGIGEKTKSPFSFSL